MFTVLSNTRNSNLFLIGGLAIAMVVLLAFGVVPAISAPQSVAAPVARLSEAGSDYYLRHPELSISAAPAVDLNSDFYLRHSDWTSNVQNIIPVTGNSELSDYFQRHQELSAPAGTAVDTADYFLRHSELRPAAPSTDLSDYFLRH